MILSRVVEKIRKATGFHPGFFRSHCRQCASAILRVATAVLLVALLVSAPVAVSAAASAHSSMSGAAAFILAAAFGENTDFNLTSEVRPGTRSFHGFSDAVAEIADARVFGGIHFRTSCVRANTLGRAVADYVSRHAMRPPGDEKD